MRFLILGLCLMFCLASGNSHANGYIPVQYKLDTFGGIMGLHLIKDRNFVWWECGESLTREEGRKRAFEYADAIKASQEYVHTRTGVTVPTHDIVAVLFQESSMDECVIGRRESHYLAEKLGRRPRRAELVAHVQKWIRAKNRAYRACRGSTRADCMQSFMQEHYPKYADIRGWDLGVAQYRWPSSRLKSRKLVMPSGKVYEGITLSDLFDHEVSIQLLVEDLARFWGICSQEHKHYYHREGRRMRRIRPEEAYLVHHHAGIHQFSQRNWLNLRRHLRTLRRHAIQPVARIMQGPMNRNGIFRNFLSFSFGQEIQSSVQTLFSREKEVLGVEAGCEADSNLDL